MQLSVHLGAQDQLSASYLRLEAFPLAVRDLEAEGSLLFLVGLHPEPIVANQVWILGAVIRRGIDHHAQSPASDDRFAVHGARIAGGEDDFGPDVLALVARRVGAAADVHRYAAPFAAVRERRKADGLVAEAAEAFAERLFDPQLAFARCPGHRPYVRGIPRVAVGGKPLHLDVANAVSLEVVHHPITRPRKPGARLDAVELGNAADVFERALARILANDRLKLRLRNDVLVEWFGRG